MNVIIRNHGPKRDMSGQKHVSVVKVVSSYAHPGILRKRKEFFLHFIAQIGVYVLPEKQSW